MASKGSTRSPRSHSRLATDDHARVRLRTRARRLSWSGLVALWREINSGEGTPSWPAGKALEYLLLRAFEIDGAKVTWPYEVSLNGIDEQIDGAIHTGELHCLVECKDTADAANVEPLAKLRNQLLRRHSGVVGLVVSRAGFTPPATTLAHYVGPQAILLWSGDELEFALRKKRIVRYLHLKYRQHVEHGMPNYDIRSDTL